MKRLIVGISGASGVILGIRLLETIRGRVESHLVLTPSAKEIVSLETSHRVEEIESAATFVHDSKDLAASISSGSFQTDGMVVIPCSIKTLSSIANSYNHNLLVRAADVTLKERRRLVLVVRETPLHMGHLRLMTQATEMGAVILPPVPGFYCLPKTIDDVVNHTVGKALDQFGIEHNLYPRWKGGGGLN
jgi:4-hydroxy-3-polyprenylbenzoate decarboxylase